MCVACVVCFLLWGERAHVCWLIRDRIRVGGWEDIYTYIHTKRTIHSRCPREDRLSGFEKCRGERLVRPEEVESKGSAEEGEQPEEKADGGYCLMFVLCVYGGEGGGRKGEWVEDRWMGCVYMYVYTHTNLPYPPPYLHIHMYTDTANRTGGSRSCA